MQSKLKVGNWRRKAHPPAPLDHHSGTHTSGFSPWWRRDQAYLYSSAFPGNLFADSLWLVVGCEEDQTSGRKQNWGPGLSTIHRCRWHWTWCHCNSGKCSARMLVQLTCPRNDWWCYRNLHMRGFQDYTWLRGARNANCSAAQPQTACQPGASSSLVRWFCCNQPHCRHICKSSHPPIAMHARTIYLCASTGTRKRIDEISWKFFEK